MALKSMGADGIMRSERLFNILHGAAITPDDFIIPAARVREPTAFAEVAPAAASPVKRFKIRPAGAAAAAKVESTMAPPKAVAVTVAAPAVAVPIAAAAPARQIYTWKTNTFRPMGGSAGLKVTTNESKKLTDEDMDFIILMTSLDKSPLGLDTQSLSERILLEKDPVVAEKLRRKITDYSALKKAQYSGFLKLADPVRILTLKKGAEPLFT